MMDFWEGLGVALVSAAVGNEVGKASRQKEIDEAYWRGRNNQFGITQKRTRLLLYQKQQAETRIQHLEDRVQYLEKRDQEREAELQSLRAEKQSRLEAEIGEKLAAFLQNPPKRKTRQLPSGDYAPDWTDPPLDNHQNGHHPDN